MLIDSHVHLPSPEVHKGHQAEGFFKNVADSVAYLKKCNVTGIIFNMWRGIFADTEEDLDVTNRQVLEIYEQNHGYFYPGAVIHPRFPETSRKWLEHFNSQGLKWVGELLPYHCGIEFDKPEWMQLFEICDRNGQIVQLHGSKGVVEVARQFPNLKIVSCHVFPELLKDLAAQPNIMLDMSGTDSGQRLGKMELALAHFGPDRLIWGSDFQAHDPASFYSRAINAFPDEATREKVFSKNVLRLLKYAGAQAFVVNINK